MIIGFAVGNKKTLMVNEDFRKKVEAETLENNPIPVCDSGKCPEYQNFDTDKDGESENVVIEPIGMSQFAGRVLIIDEGRVTFRSGLKMFINVRPVKEHENDNGFIIRYSTEPNAQSNDTFEEAFYKYQDGKYILEKTTKFTPSKSD